MTDAVRILILSESIAGEGHSRAARSLAAAIQELMPTARVRVVNALSYVSPRLENLTRVVYRQTLQSAPRLWGWAYEMERPLSSLMKERLGRVVAARLKPLLEQERPDLIVCTHAFAIGAVVHLRRLMGLSCRIGAVITDFDINGFWVHEDVDFYLVSGAVQREKLVRDFGIPAERIFPTGIPIDPRFGEVADLPDRGRLRRVLGLAEERFTLLLAGGGMGIGPFHALLEQLAQRIDAPLQVLVVTGYNRALYDELTPLVRSYRHRLVVFPYVHNMHELMAASDVMITKPGGLTTSEALALGLPLVLLEAFPGQETRNRLFLVEHGAALACETVEEAVATVQALVADPKRLAALREGARRLGNPHSSRDAARIALNHLPVPQVVEQPSR